MGPYHTDPAPLGRDEDVGVVAGAAEGVLMSKGTHLSECSAGRDVDVNGVAAAAEGVVPMARHDEAQMKNSSR